MRLGNALLGATPAKPANTARINDRPCAVRSEVLWTRRDSVRDDRLMSVIYGQYQVRLSRGRSE